MLMTIERIDTRKLDPSAREQLRKTAIRMHKRGRSQTSISEELGVRRSTIVAWIGRSGSGAGTKEAKRGRSLGECRRLTVAQEAKLRQDIVDKTPDQMKLSFALWNAKAVRLHIKQCFLIDLPIRSVRRYLNRWGFTPQRPLKRAFEQKPEAVRKWLETDYPMIAARAKAEGAEIYWGDETAVSSVEHYPRGYAPKGKTPVLVLSQSKRERINLISAVTNRGTMRFMLYRETMTAEVLIRFMQRLIKDAGRKIFLILDNLKVHHSKAVTAWLDKNREKIDVFFLPTYSPELNPDEYMNGELKTRMNMSEPARSGDHLRKKVMSHLKSIQSQPRRVRAYFRAAPVSYAA
jgi:transposase